jgi:hypothetical protein
MGHAGQDRSNQAYSIPVNTLIFDYKLGSPEERIGPFSYFNKVPIEVEFYELRLDGLLRRSDA